MPVEKFHQDGTRLLGFVGMVACLVAVGAVLADGLGRSDLGWAALFFLLGSLAWSALVRPQVLVDDERLVLRNMLDTVTIPIAAVEEVEVRRVMVVLTAEDRYVSPAVSRPLRALVRGRPAGRLDAQGLPDLVEARIRQRASDARAHLGVRRGEVATDVHRGIAWLEVTLIMLGSVGLLAAVVL